MGTQSWEQVMVIPHCIIESIGSAGMVEVYDPRNGEKLDQEDLRICIHLDGGTDLVINSNARLVYTSTGIVIEELTLDA